MIAVSALSRGLGDAQGEILEPLTGVGTDISVTRPIVVEGDDGGGGGGGGRFGNLSEPELGISHGAPPRLAACLP